jgi:phosphatidate cytidylyltransferase
MRGRIFSTLVLWAIVACTLVFLRFDGVVCLAALAAALTQYEFYQMLARTGHRPMMASGIVFGLLMMLSPFYLHERSISGVEFLAPATIWFSLVGLMRRPRGNAINSLAATLAGLVLVPYMLLFIPLIIVRFGGGTPGLMLALWVVAATKFTDMGALLVGMAIGRHRMAPNLSPKKTWEGAIGGIVVSAALSAALVSIFRDVFPAGFEPWMAAALSPPVSVAAIFGDLLESAFKRESGVKDSGNLIPGIGGVFDLTDSFMLAAPVGYFALAATLS